MSTPVESIELRCPGGSRNLFARIVDGKIEVACNACRRLMRMIGADVQYVIHIWNIEGDLIETRTVLADEEDPVSGPSNT